MKFNSIFTSVVLLTSSIFMTSCGDEEVTISRMSGFEPFLKNYNSHIKTWLEDSLVAENKRLKELEDQLASNEDESKRTTIEKEIAEVQRVITRFEYRLSLKEFFSIKKKEEVPTDLVWENGMDNPIIGDPRAKKGGTYHTYRRDYPDTFRPIGKNSNTGLRSELYDDIDMGLVSMHPLTKKYIPGLAKEWAFGKDGKTMFYRLDPDATYSDGVKVQVKDFLFSFYIRLSDNVYAPFQKQYYKQQYANVTVYGDDVLSVTLPEPKPLLPLAASAQPYPPHFYSEYGPDYDERYQWRVAPTTGGYTLLEENVNRGRSVTLTRVKDWWAKDKKFYKYSNNVDKIHYQIIAEKTKAFELFRMGKLDMFSLSEPEYWYDKMEIDEYFKGYIEKVQFYNIFPRVPRGFYLNTHVKPMDDINVRLGLSHAFDFHKINTILFRGDNERLEQFSDGFGEYTDSDIKARKYDILKARDYFAKAGYTKQNASGYLTNGSGEVLKIEISWGKGSLYDKMMPKLQESAKKAGVKVVLDGQNGNVFFTKMLEKRHMVGFVGWAVQPPFPRYFQFFHSENAFDKKGNLKSQTNNMNSYNSPIMDKLCEKVRFATSEQELKEAAFKIQQIVHDEGLFIPVLKTSYVRVAQWRWLKFPQTNLYQYNVPEVYYPDESYLYWIDQDLKAETLKDRKEGRELEEQNSIFDLYRYGLPKLEDLEKREPTKL